MFVLQAAIAWSFFFFFTMTFTGNKYLPHLVCLVFFVPNLYASLRRGFLDQPLGINYM